MFRETSWTRCEHCGEWNAQKMAHLKKNPEKFIAFFIYNDEILISSRLRLKSWYTQEIVISEEGKKFMSTSCACFKDEK